MTNAVLKLPDLESELSELTAELVESFAGEDRDAASPQLLRHYIKRVARFGITAGRGGFPQIHDLCVHFQEILRAVSQQQQAVGEETRNLLEQWPLLVMSYLNTEDKRETTDALMQLMADRLWPVPLGETEREELASALLEQDIRSNGDAAQVIAPMESSDSAAAPGEQSEEACIEQTTHTVSSEEPEDHAVNGGQTLELLQQELDAALSVLFAAGSEATPDDDATLAPRVEAAAEGLSLFGISAASAGLVGVMDVAQLLSTTLGELVSRPAAERAALLDYLMQCQDALQRYLNHPDEDNAVDALVALLRRMPYGDPLTDEEAQGLHDLLSAEEIALDATADALQVPDGEEQPRLEDRSETAPHSSPSPTGIPPKYAEFLKLVSMEFDSSLGALAEDLRTILSDDATEAEREEAVSAYDDLLERFALVTETIGLHGLSQFLNIVKDYLARASDSVGTSGTAAQWLAAWPARVQAYLQNPLDEAHIAALGEHCRAGQALLGIEAAFLEQLIGLFSQPDFSIEEEEDEPRQTQAQPDDVSLALPDDVNQQLLDSLLQELPNQTQAFSAAIARMVGGEGSLADVDLAQRIAHTLKGSANTVGVVGIANLTHHIEDILLAFSKEQQLPAAPLTITLQEAADVLEMMSETLLGMGDTSQEQALQVLQAVLDWANQIDLNGLPESHDLPVQAQTSTSQAATPGSDPEAASQSAMRVPAAVVDELLRLAGESIIVSGQLQQGLQQTLVQNQAVRDQSTLFQQLAFELEQLVDVRGLSFHLRGEQGSDFDALEMDQYNELHTVTRRLVEAATDARELTQGVEEQLKHLEGLLVSQARTHKETQETVMQTRMLPAQTIVPRLQRSVRQACRLTGKQAELSIVGAQTLMDGDVLHALADPLMHILRNSIDHGIEAPEERERLGKESIGLINLTFYQEGDSVIVRCVDDGRGIDYEAVRRIATENDLLDAEAGIEDTELNRFIFLSGFSTKEEATQVSGRGIGMDAVFKQIMELKGTVSVESSQGRGLAVEIRLPLTMTTIHGLLVRVGEQVMAVSSRGVDQVLHADSGELVEEQGRLRYQHGEQDYEAVFIETLLGQPQADAQADQPRRPVLIVTTETDRRVAVLVEQVLTTQDLVIKQLGQYVPAIIGIEGSTILGDGSVAPVLDMQGLFLSRDQSNANTRPASDEHRANTPTAPTVMVVDDSLSARRSLAEFMSDVGYEIVTARDGIDAIEKLEERLPDILLVDLEMPRMNGLELTMHIRANQQTEHLPVIMITSRATEKHRREAERAGIDEYLTKPYTEDELLDHVQSYLTRMSKTA